MKWWSAAIPVYCFIYFTDHIKDYTANESFYHGALSGFALLVESFIIYLIIN